MNGFSLALLIGIVAGMRAMMAPAAGLTVNNALLLVMFPAALDTRTE